MSRRYEGFDDTFDQDRDFGDETDYPQDTVVETPYDEGRYREQTTYDLVNLIQEYLGFSTKADLQRLIKENF